MQLYQIGVFLFTSKLSKNRIFVEKILTIKLLTYLFSLF